VSASTIYYQLCPPDSYRDEAPPIDADTAEMNRLRGLVIVQASETETVLGRILRWLSPSADTNRPAGTLLHEVSLALTNLPDISCTDTLDLIRRAIRRRNRVLHDTVTIGSVWAPFSESDVEWVPVISLLGLELCDEEDLRTDLGTPTESDRRSGSPARRARMSDYHPVRHVGKILTSGLGSKPRRLPARYVCLRHPTPIARRGDIQNPHLRS
jgi:hypothetical protein